MHKENPHIANSLLNSFKAFVGSHFLLNAINAIQSDVILKNNQSAFETLQIFNRMYKNSIRSSNDQMTPLGSEMDFLSDYLAMEQIRFSGQHIPKINRKQLNSETPIPTFIFQSLIENALLLSLTQKKMKLNIEIKEDNNSIALCLDIKPRPEEQIHVKVKGKTELTLHRLDLLQENQFINYQLDWGSNYFMQLILSKT